MYTYIRYKKHVLLIADSLTNEMIGDNFFLLLANIISKFKRLKKKSFP